MARKAPSAVTEGSQKENSDLSSQHNGSKMTQDKATKNTRLRRAGPNNDDERRDSQREENDDEAYQDSLDPEDANEDDEDNENENGAGSSKGHKRARANSLGESHPSSSQRVKAEIKPKTLPRDVDG